MGLSASQQLTLKNLRKLIEREISDIAPAVLDEYPIDLYVQQLDDCDRQYVYNVVPHGIQIQCVEISRKHGAKVLGLLHKLLLVSLLENVDMRQERHRIPDSIQRLLLKEVDRILLQIETLEEGFYLHHNDLFAKDLGLCRLKLVPCGSEFVELYGGIPRSTLFRGGVSQLLRMGFFIAIRVRGFKPLYDSHWDRRLVRQFSKEGYDLCYMRIAELLKLHPEVKGLCGSSWWFDPEVENVVPELVFLRAVPEENGARFFRVGTDVAAIKDATLFSGKRKTLVEAGKYKPCRFMMVWPRDSILTYAQTLERNNKMGKER